MILKEAVQQRMERKPILTYQEGPAHKKATLQEEENPPTTLVTLRIHQAVTLLSSPYLETSFRHSHILLQLR